MPPSPRAGRRARAVSAANAIALLTTAVTLLSGCAARDDRARVETLPSPAAPGSGEPSLVAGYDGRVYLSWLEPLDSAQSGAARGHALRLAVLENGRWSETRTVRSSDDLFVNWADFPSVAVLGDGRIAAHWLQRSGPGTYAYGVRVAQSSDDGRTWSAPVIPHRDSSLTEHGFVAMWPDSMGAVGAVWLDGRKYRKDGHDAANEMMLASTTIAADGKVGAERVLDERTCDCCQNAVAVTSAGPIVAYRDRSPAEIRDIYVTRRVDGKWTTGVPVHADNWHIAACPVNGPQLAARGRDVAIVWFTAANDSPRVNVAFSADAGATFGAPVRVDAGNPAGRVDVVLLPDGAALVTWIERTGGDTALVQARRVRADTRIDRPITIAASSAARASGFPRMTLSGNDVVFAWTVPGAASGQPARVQVARLPLASLE